MNSKRNRRRLSEEESILWHRVGRTVTPLRDRKAELKAASHEEARDEFLDAMDDTAPKVKKRATPKIGVSRPHAAARKPAGPVPARAPQRDIDRPTTRKIAKGRISIDGRIDLHEMTQDQAHDRLYLFLADARSRGCRHLLIVTGKGRSPGSEGVLRRMVPIWLNSGRFAGLVSGYSSATRQHGGEGAIYVRLKKLANADGSVRP